LGDNLLLGSFLAKITEEATIWGYFFWGSFAVICPVGRRGVVVIVSNGIERSWARISPGCKVFRTWHIALLFFATKIALWIFERN
jgi:hypothetical protein